MYENRSNWAWSQVSLVAMFNTSPISTKCDITVRTCKLLRRIIPLEEIDQNCLQLSYALFFRLIYISLTFSERDAGIALSYSDKNHFEASISRKTNFKSSIWKWQRRHFWKLRENTLLSSWRHDGQDQQTKRQPGREPWERGWQNEQTTYQVHPPLVPRFISSQVFWERTSEAYRQPYQTVLKLLFGRGPNRVMATACFDANVQ